MERVETSASASSLCARIVRILLLDPRPMTSEALRSLLEDATKDDPTMRFSVSVAPRPVPSTPDGDLDLVLLYAPDIPDASGTTRACIASLAAQAPRVPVVVYSDARATSDAAAAVRWGARGFLPSSLGTSRVIEALRLVACGLAVIPAECLQRASTVAAAPVSRQLPTPGRGEEGGFTRREREILIGLRDGKPNKAIARELGLSQSTVKVHVRSVFNKLGVRNRTEAALVASRHLGAAMWEH